MATNNFTTMTQNENYQISLVHSMGFGFIRHSLNKNELSSWQLFI